MTTAAGTVVQRLRVECDEIWSFLLRGRSANKAKVTAGLDGVGDIWTWVGIDADTKLVISWLVSQGKDAVYAIEFMTGLACRRRL